MPTQKSYLPTFPGEELPESVRTALGSAFNSKCNTCIRITVVIRFFFHFNKNALEDIITLYLR